MKKNKIGKYISLEASEDESDFESEDLDDIVDFKPTPQIGIAQKIEEKYASAFKDIFDEDEEVESVEEGLMQSQLMPKISSPRLFLIRVKRGVEKDIALRILGNKPNICSVIVKNGLRGYIYIEAFQKQNVLDSFGKVRGINKNKVSIVPQDEMIDALTYRNDFKNVEFGRIRKGKYKGDLASIIDSEGDMVTIRIVPRINGIKKLFNPNEFKNEIIKKDKNSYFYKRDFYVNGFLEKEILRSSIDLNTEPNFEELELFQIKRFFEVGDKVRIIKGELIGLEGIVMSLMGNTITIQTKNRKNYEVLSDSLEKFYSVGEEVCFENENGIITNYSDGIYFVALRDFTEEVKVSIDKLKKPIPLTKEIIRRERPRQIFRKDNLVNKQVQIKKGKFKGHTGIVKDVYMNKCRVQINSNLSFITIPREDMIEIVRELEAEYVTSYSRNTAFKTPGYEFENIKTDTLETPKIYDTTSIYAGALVWINGEICKVEDFIGETFFTKNGTYDKNEITFVKPKKNEDVIVMEGDYKGSKAVVLDIREDVCIVKINNGLIKNLSIGSVCKQEVV